MKGSIAGPITFALLGVAFTPPLHLSAREAETSRLKTIREAYEAAVNNLGSGKGVGEYEVYASKPGKAEELELFVKAKATISFQANKYHIQLDYEKDKAHGLRTRKLANDGTALVVSRWAPNYPRGPEGEIFGPDSEMPNMRRAGFDYNPCKLPGCQQITPAFFEKPPPSLTISSDNNGNYNAAFDPLPEVHCTFVASASEGYNVTAYRTFLTKHDNFLHFDCRTTWDRKNGVWFVKSIDTRWRFLDGHQERTILRYTSFEPNAAVPESLFKMSSLSITARLLDRRPDAEEPVIRVSNVAPADDKEGTLADSIRGQTQPQPSKAGTLANGTREQTPQPSKADTLVDSVPEETPPQPPPSAPPSSQYYLLFTAPLVVAIGLALLWLRKRRKVRS